MNMKLDKIVGKYLISLPIIIGLILRLVDITKSSIWHDEGYTMWLLRYDFHEIIERTARDVHPPMYYLISKLWVSVFGGSVFSIRFLSLLFSLGIIYLTFKIVELIWSKKAAFWSALLVAFSPFMIRFAQEARMYGVVAFFTTLGTYFLVKYIKEKNNKYLLYYVTAMIFAMYTQYYSFFVIISHWIILAVFTEGFFSFNWKKSLKQKVGVFSLRWWLANISLLLLYSPWFPIAFKQVTRVNGSYWIRPEWITIRTIPNNILQFTTYAHMDAVYFWNSYGPVIYWITIAILIGLGLMLFFQKEKKRIALSLFIFGYLPMILVFVLSKLRTPVYQDRYFPFSAIAIFAIWGCVISIIKARSIRYILGIMFLAIMSGGIYIMHQDANHHMKELYLTVEKEKKAGDIVLSGELYTFLDGTYYFGDKNILLLSEKVDGYGETSLFYDQQNDYIVNKRDVGGLGSRIWVIGKTGEKDYFSSELWKDHNSKTYFEEYKNNGLKAVLYTK